MSLLVSTEWPLLECYLLSKFFISAQSRVGSVTVSTVIVSMWFWWVFMFPQGGPSSYLYLKYNSTSRAMEGKAATGRSVDQTSDLFPQWTQFCQLKGGMGCSRKETQNCVWLLFRTVFVCLLLFLLLFVCCVYMFLYYGFVNFHQNWHFKMWCPVGFR